MIEVLRVLLEPDIVADFLDKNDLDLICRGHLVLEDGYEFLAKRRLVTIFQLQTTMGSLKMQVLHWVLTKSGVVTRDFFCSNRRYKKNLMTLIPFIPVKDTSFIKQKHSLRS